MNAAFSIIFPDRVDEATGLNRCRFCGKTVVPSPGQRRKYYCNTGCYNACIEIVSWERARILAYQRDGGICQMCGTKVYLWGNGNVEESVKAYLPTWHDYARPFLIGERQAEEHHIIPQVDLYELAFDVTREIEDEARRTFWNWKLAVMLVLDVNNLQTLCKAPCHDKAHGHAWHIRQKLKNVKRLDEWIGESVGRI